MMVWSDWRAFFPPSYSIINKNKLDSYPFMILSDGPAVIFMMINISILYLNGNLCYLRGLQHMSSYLELCLFDKLVVILKGPFTINKQMVMVSLRFGHNC